MWQDNTSWKEGLLSAVTYENVSKLKSLSPLKNHAIYDRKDAGKGDDWSNLVFQAILGEKDVKLSSNPLLDALGLYKKNHYYIVAVDTSKRETQHSLDIKTRNGFQGKVLVTFEYQVLKPDIISEVPDPVSVLKREVGELVQDIVADEELLLIKELKIKKKFGEKFLRIKSPTEDEIKIKVIDVKFTWPESIQQVIDKDRVSEIETIMQQRLNDREIQKFITDTGITDPYFLAWVRSRTDSDYRELIEFLDNRRKSSYEDQERKITELLERFDKDITPQQKKSLIDTLINTKIEQVKRGSFPSNSLLSDSLPSQNRKRLGKKESSDSHKRALDEEDKTSN